MLKALYNIPSVIFSFIYSRFFFQNIHLNKNKKIYLFDIDNTLADTYHSFNYNYKSRRVRLSSLAVFLNMRQLIISLKKNKENKIIFLTARRFYDLWITKSWLKSIGIKTDYFDIIIVDNPEEKYFLIKKILKKYKINISYIDDLSHNHENNNMQIYSIVKKVNNVPIKYFGYDQIHMINNNDLQDYDLDEYYFHN